MRDTFDIVIIGAGHNGLVAALELVRAGLSVCVLEARDHVGGCAITTEPLLPRFRHDPHANCFLFADIMPRSIAPPTLKVDVLQPEAQFGIAFADGRPPVIIHRPDRLAATRASLSLYSTTDAARFVEMKRRSAKFGPMLRQGLYAAPDRAWFETQRRAVARTFGSFCDATNLGTGSARQIIDTLFTTPEIRTLLYVLAIETGVALDDAGGDVAFLGFSPWLVGRWRIPVGGMQSYTNALRDTARAAGVEVRASTPAARVVVEKGRANGVRTDSGEVYAAQAVVAATPVLSLFDDLLAADRPSSAERGELEAFRASAAPSVGTAAFALDWAPRYKSGAHDDQIDRCLKTVIGFDDPSDVLDHEADVRAGMLPRPGGVVRVHSRWDHTLAPDGHHVAAVDSRFPATAALSASTWRQVEVAFPSALFQTWQRHLIDEHPAPPMTMSLDDSRVFERRMLLRLGDAQYRTSVAGLYIAGPGVYPGGGVHGACGLNAAATIVRDRLD